MLASSNASMHMELPFKPGLFLALTTTLPAIFEDTLDFLEEHGCSECNI